MLIFTALFTKSQNQQVSAALISFMFVAVVSFTIRFLLLSPFIIIIIW